MAQRAGNAVNRLRRVFYSRYFFSIVALVVISCISGCGRGSGPGGTSGVDPTDAAEQAIELYDKDGSGSLSESELAACPGILSARSYYDTDGNQEISADEIAARLTSIAGGSQWVTVNCQVIQSGRPLAGAKVRFDPEPFLKDSLQPASGTTDSQGRVHPAVVDEQLPADFKGLHIMRLGIYRVEVEHASVTQPHKPLGFEISELVRGGTEPVIRL